MNSKFVPAENPPTGAILEEGGIFVVFAYVGPHLLLLLLVLIGQELILELRVRLEVRPTSNSIRPLLQTDLKVGTNSSELLLQARNGITGGRGQGGLFAVAGVLLVLVLVLFAATTNSRLLLMTLLLPIAFVTVTNINLNCF